jgi:divalent metal cation (Fe/Co/Zn/Cd) transporter
VNSERAIRSNVHRRRLPSYGSGKIESCLNLLIGVALAASSIWVFGLGVLRLLHPPPAHPLGLAGAVMIAAVNVIRTRGCSLWSCGLRATAGSVLIKGQVRTRLLRLISSIMATVAILISAIFTGHMAGVFADLAGSAVVFQVMIWTAYQLIASSLPDLLDWTLDEPQRAAINGVDLRRRQQISRHVRQVSTHNHSLCGRIRATPPSLAGSDIFCAAVTVPCGH